jgi:hypothetical protein
MPIRIPGYQREAYLSRHRDHFFTSRYGDDDVVLYTRVVMVLLCKFPPKSSGDTESQTHTKKKPVHAELRVSIPRGAGVTKIRTNVI